MIEFVVAMPLLLLMCIGVMDFGRVYFSSIAVANAARAGAEWGIAQPVNAFLPAKQQSFAQLDGAEVGTITFTPAPSTVCRCGGTVVGCATTPNCPGGYGVPRVYVTVTAKKVVALLLPYPGLPSSITIVRSATFRSQ